MCRLAALAWLLATNAAASNEVTLEGQCYTLNADLVLAHGPELGDSVILIVHGTLAHKDMELISTLQQALFEAGRNSLAINLSLNINNRKGFFPCAASHTHQSVDAVTEIGLWVDWLSRQGVTQIILLGHSRGANQVAKFVLQDSHRLQGAVLLAPSIDVSVADNMVLLHNDQIAVDGWLEDIDFLHCENAKVKVSTYLSYYGLDAANDSIPLIQQMVIPTLVVSGSEDEVVPMLPLRMTEIENSLVTHVEIPLAGHFFRDLNAYDVVDALVASFGTAQGQTRQIAFAVSLQADARLAQSTGRPILVFVSQPECEYCELLREKILYPMIRSGKLQERVILREVSLDPEFVLKGYDGRLIEGQQLAAGFDVRVTPTLLLLDEQGKSLVDPLVGIANIELYEFYLNKAIDIATARLNTNNKPRGEELK